MQISEFEDSLVYIVSSRTARDIQKNQEKKSVQCPWHHEVELGSWG